MAIVNPDSVAQDQIKAFVERIMRLREEERAIKGDIREVYAEAKGNGFDKTVLGKLVNYIEKRNSGAADLQEAEALFDLYLSACDGAVGTVRATHTHEATSSTAARKDVQQPTSGYERGVGSASGNPRSAREGLGPYIPEAGTQAPPVETNSETHERASTNDEASPEAGPQAEASPAGTGTGTLADREARHEGEAVSADLPTLSAPDCPAGEEAGEAQPGETSHASPADIPEPAGSHTSDPLRSDAATRKDADTPAQEPQPAGSLPAADRSGGHRAPSSSLEAVSAPVPLDRTKPHPDCQDPEDCGVHGSWNFMCGSCLSRKAAVTAAAHQEASEGRTLQ